MSDPLASARELHDAGRLNEAAAAYREVLEVDPDSAGALNNLGIVYQEQGRLDAAVEMYRRGVERNPDSARLHFNLAHVLHDLGRLDEAAASYKSAIALEPDSAAYHHNLGHVLYDLGHCLEAIATLRRALKLEPGLMSAHSCLASALHDEGHLDDALASSRLAVQARPDDPAEHFSQARILADLGRFEDATAKLRETIGMDPHSIVARESLVAVLVQAGDTKSALTALDEWMEWRPDDPSALHLRAALTGEDVSPRASDAYVESLFDNFAHDFDQTLNRLDYRAPTLVANVVAHECPEAGAILDAGCGTGLCGPLLKPHAARLVGVDLSKGMLEKAEARAVYDELIHAELTEYLVGAREEYDVIAAADCLNYFGDLDAVFAAAAGALRRSGLMAFTLEHLAGESDDRGFRLNPHGRYSHTVEYVHAAAAAAGLTVRASVVETLRTEGAKPVRGLLVTVLRAS